MHRSFRRLLVVAATGAVALAMSAGPAAGSGSAAGAASTARLAASTATAPKLACTSAAAGRFRCLAEYRSTTKGTRLHPLAANATPDGFGPADLKSAYRLPGSGGTGTVAVVDAYGYPTAEADLAAYRSQYGLPACTVASGCLRIANQRGDTTPLPDPDPGWGVETALDLDMASAACSGCKLLLVEGDDNSLEGLAASVDTAVRLGATVVSNSYGTDEFNGMGTYAGSYNHPRVPILASSGDYGFQAASFPAVEASVIAVGGTSLTKGSSARGWSERAWSGAGSGCSAWIDKPAWQTDANCGMRTVADVSAVADPDTGLAVYDSYGLGDQAGWLVVGGTSASSPFVAGVIALAGHASTVTPQKLYGEPGAFFDAVGGSNGYCGGDYLCTGLPGYDAPTGLGSPNGITPFE